MINNYHVCGLIDAESIVWFLGDNSFADSDDENRIGIEDGKNDYGESGHNDGHFEISGRAFIQIEDVFDCRIDPKIPSSDNVKDDDGQDNYFYCQKWGQM
jgi:hypothetical protein